MIETIRSLIDDRLPALGPGTPDLAVRPRLQQVASELPKNDFVAACMAGLWLLHDFLDESHNTSQELDTLEGSYWHGILHRREPDYWNAKYWFRRVPTHPIFAELGKRAAELGVTELPKKWDPAAFVDLCEQASRGPETLAMQCRRVQRAEWDLLFAYCLERAGVS